MARHGAMHGEEGWSGGLVILEKGDGEDNKINLFRC